MFENPNYYIKTNCIRSNLPITDNQIQPNGIDLRVRSVSKVLDGGNTFVLTASDEKIHVPKDVMKEDDLSYIEGRSGSAYIIDFEEYVEVPRGTVAFIYGRSSLNRNGLLIRSSVFDSGFKGQIGAVMYAFSSFRIQRGARLAQIVFARCDTASLYNGSYGEPFNAER